MSNLRVDWNEQASVLKMMVRLPSHCANCQDTIKMIKSGAIDANDVVALVADTNVHGVMIGYHIHIIKKKDIPMFRKT
jgi:hypothetical protein